VYEALILKGPIESGNRTAQLLVVDESTIHLEQVEHLQFRTSASAWVYAHEFEFLANDIMEDWNKRHFWREAMEDVCRIRRALDEARHRDPVPQVNPLLQFKVSAQSHSEGHSHICPRCSQWLEIQIDVVP
jgi:hypothetical protein